MPYEVTATRKRPQEFETLIGQEFVVSTLENAIKDGRIAHAYLFSGPRGVGKTSSARLLAKALNCAEGPTSHPCGVCESCRTITAGSNLDVIEIDGASNTSVNDVRAIKEEILFPPQFSRYKIYIIDEVHMLSTSAFNALLKTIEEPPEYVIFIFATTELQKVPATVRSRCQQFRFHLIPQHLIKEKLKEAAGESGIIADDDALTWIAKEGAGSMRDAYTLFDQVAAFSEGHIRLSLIEEKLNLAGFDKIGSIVEKAIAGDRAASIDELEALFNAGVSQEEITREMADYFRTLLLWKAGVRREDVLENPVHEREEAIAKVLEAEQIEGALKGTLSLYRDLRTSLSPKFELELFIERLSSLRFLSTPEMVMKRLQELRNEIVDGKIVEEERASETIEIKKSEPLKQDVAKVEKATLEPKKEEPSIKAPPAPPEEEDGAKDEESSSMPLMYSIGESESEASRYDDELTEEPPEEEPGVEKLYLEDEKLEEEGKKEEASKKAEPNSERTSEEEASPISGDPVDLNTLSKAIDILKSEGTNITYAMNEVREVYEDDGKFTIGVTSSPCVRMLINAKSRLERVLGRLVGRSMPLVINEIERERKEPSERMKALRRIFGGELHEYDTSEDEVKEIKGDDEDEIEEEINEESAE